MTSTFTNEWNTFKGKTSLKDATDYFLVNIEGPAVNNFAEREKTASKILNAMVTL